MRYRTKEILHLLLAALLLGSVWASGPPAYANTDAPTNQTPAAGTASPYEPQTSTPAPDNAASNKFSVTPTQNDTPSEVPTIPPAPHTPPDETPAATSTSGDETPAATPTPSDAPSVTPSVMPTPSHTPHETPPSEPMPTSVPSSTPQPTTPPWVTRLPQPKTRLLVSLEWNPSSIALSSEMSQSSCMRRGQQQDYLTDLAAGLRQMARYINHYTGGQVQISRITIDASGSQWNQADIRILANNAFRPTAFIGGQVNYPILFTSRNYRRTVFAPGPILLGRFWDGNRARCGPWSEPEGWRTLGHEWAHQALGLYDEYLELSTGNRQFCINQGVRHLTPDQIAPSVLANIATSLMAYHYTADLPSGGNPTLPEYNCNQTPQRFMHYGTAWQTLQDVFGWSRKQAGYYTGPAITILPPSTTSTNILVQQARTCANSVGTAYLIRPNPSNTLIPQRIIGQGILWPLGRGRLLRFWGVQHQSSDRAQAMVQNMLSGSRFVAPDQVRLQPSVANTLPLTRSVWQPRISLTPVLDPSSTSPMRRIIELQVALYGHHNSIPTVFYCPAGDNCLPIPFHSQAKGQTTHVLPFPSSAARMAQHGYIYARESSTGEEAVMWYQLAGGVGPAHSDGLAPAAEGLVNVEVLQGMRVSSGDVRVIYGSALPTIRSLPAGFRIIDTPLWVKIYPSGSLTHKVRVRINYSQDVVDRLNLTLVDENTRLVVLQHVDGGDWQMLPFQTRDPYLNWVSGELELKDSSAEVALGLIRGEEILGSCGEL